MLARQNDAKLQQLVVPENLIESDYYGGALERNMQQTQIAVAAFKSGVAACLNLSIGGFDTHDNHDEEQSEALINVLTLTDFVLQEVEAAGLSDQVYVFVGSDFGRTPNYNDGDGKDHWPISSFLAMGPTIEGNTVVGATDDDQLALPIDQATLQVTDSGGEKITASQIQRALRQVAGVDDYAQGLFPLSGDIPPLFG